MFVLCVSVICLQASYLVLTLRVVTIKMESLVAYSDNLAIENFREYLRIKTVQPKPDYGNICRMSFFLFTHCVPLVRRCC